MPVIAIRAHRTPASWSERILLRRVLRQDERAWTEFVRRYRALIYRCITKVTSKYAPYLPNADVDEIYADILFGLLKNDMHKLRRYNPRRGTKLSSWLGMLSINASYDYLRCQARAPYYDHSECSLELQAEHERTPLDELLEKERWEHLNHLLEGFTERDRWFLELYYDRGMDAPAIAEAMAISVKTVYSKKHKIRAHLRRSLQRKRHTHALVDLLAS